MEKGEEGGELPVKRKQAENSSALTEIPAKKLARQLDFAAVVVPEQSRVQAQVVPASVPLVMPQVQLQSQQLLQLQPRVLVASSFVMLCGSVCHLGHLVRKALAMSSVGGMEFSCSVMCNV